ncbi:uncharacterized protein [Dysidea avara]|uniref:uncharacterized protein n=1 Tax=Dysidea avara TaxID=196820 RepID=UPI00331CF276
MDFNIVLATSKNVFISNIEMINCGDTVSDNITNTITKAVPAAYFGHGIRFAIMLYQVTNTSIVNVTMRNTLGYGIVAFNALGVVNLIEVTIINTTFENDQKHKCTTFDYDSLESKTNFSCSGSGILFFYHDILNGSLPNTDLFVNKCMFHGNKNILPTGSFDANTDALNSGYYHEPLPVIGAGSITLVFTQSMFNVTSMISNTIFSNNIGTLSPTVSIFCVATIKGITKFDNCTFDNNKPTVDLSRPYLFHPTGGISLYYTLLRNAPAGINTTPLKSDMEINLLTVIKSNFTRLMGKSGAGIYVKKISPDAVTIVVNIEECNFIGNKADTGSALYAVESKFQGLSFRTTGGLSINVINVNAVNNSLSHGSTLSRRSSRLITGVFSFDNCLFTVTCTKQCDFSGNQPSVLYGHNSAIVLSGEAEFKNNEAEYGGALVLINTVAYVNTGSKLFFGHNYALTKGGAIDVYFSSINVQSEDICPIQFIGNTTEPIFNLSDLNHESFNVSITFENNTADDSYSPQSIYANVFYVCSWYPNTTVQINFGIYSPIVNDTRPSVYRQLFKFGPNETASDQLLIAAYLPCICSDNGTHNGTNDYNFTECSQAQNRKLNKSIVPGKSFNISLITLDIVGSVGYSSRLDAEVYSENITDEMFLLDSGQDSRSFSLTNKKCTPIEFVIYGKYNKLYEVPRKGILRLSVAKNFEYEFTFNVNDRCPPGFEMRRKNELQIACLCDNFFNSSVKGNINCDSKSGLLTRSNRLSWLSVVEGDLQFVRLCLATYCNNHVEVYDLSDNDILCVNNRTGRACGACQDGFSKVFGSDICKMCTNDWLVTILLYGVLGIVLVLVIVSLKLTVTLGAINGLIFFCNIISINEQLFFNVNNTSFSFVRVFISIINLDLGFTLCFYDGMTELVKSGLQFVFPIYLWLIIYLIVFACRRYLHHKNMVIKASVPVLATLILLSYSKILRTIIEVFSSITVKSSNDGSIIVWEPDPTVVYLTDGHIPLFFIAVCFFIFFIFPIAIGFTFPSVVLRSKKLSYFFPLIDSFLAPYKDKYRYWFGIRLLVLIYLSIMEAIVFQYTEVLLVSSIAVVGAFAILQAYFQPLKSTLINILELAFMSIFLLLSALTLYLYPSIYGYRHVNTAVTVFGTLAFVLFCLVILFHLHNITKSTNRYASVCRTLDGYFGNYLPKKSIETLIMQPQHLSSSNTEENYFSYNRYRESLLEHL